ncbi:FMN-dependent alpha-hydroxy acid dehydrogenase [Ruminiclostridium papyrosolvens DSM 2782]|uniref:FMN-dependent alpha-hydroxy acid dehydrogenase n=1 Tax=Ruminiclostridium papyrosolvens DSM 2782 TaxID=588581 RepID=F1T854_9FIRM|nr:alpha-hydroxy acid oxidase [Ruminiclostridium papyrosolvens]EGD49652.1 FMN-dependent alpha-hydroxy acid dehydrogenase [Ruminiclostridium papyrosolvens DSM 2782]WES33217.1 alpha-hydroxy acid oxidase [Ruminiclostridium papyrosolvens DSM 2782]
MKQNIQHNYRAGDSDEITRHYFDSLLIEMRHIDSVLPSTALELYGENFSSPIMTAALSHLKIDGNNGMVEMAKGAKASNAVMWTGMGDEAELEAITATGAKTIKIIKPHSDNNIIFKRIEHAEKCGVLALGMDIDHSFNSKGDFDNVLGFPMSGKTLDEIKEFVNATKLPFIIKGVLSEKDTYKCLEAGVKGIVISHHHGIIDYAVPPLMVLPKIAKMVKRSIPIFVDCGIASGIDVFKALALGADAVSVGRTLIPHLNKDGADGVRNIIEEMTKELAGVMARTCSKDIASIDASVIWQR